MMAVIASVLCGFVALFVLWFFVLRKKAIKSKFELRGPRGYPLIGSVLDFLPSIFQQSCERFANEYGGVLVAYLFGNRMLIISDLAIVKEILMKRPKVFRRDKALDYSAKILGVTNGVFNAHGPEWSRIRKITSPTLAKHHVMKKTELVLTEA